MLRKIPYVKSSLFKGIEWTNKASKYPGSGTDMHWCAWGSDGALYCVDDDGSNFGGPWHFAHFLKVQGTPPHHRVEEISMFPDLMRPEDGFRKRRYVAGAGAVDDRLFASVFDYNSEEPGFEFWFMDRMSRHGGTVGLMYSDDGGRTWMNTPGVDAPYFLGPNFAALQFVAFGPGYSNVPGSLDGYVYLISNDVSWESGDHVYLARAPRERILERGAWEFFSGMGEGHIETAAEWSAQESDAKPILTDQGHVGHPSMTYAHALDRFILLVFSDTVPHSMDTPPEIARDTWDKYTELQIYEGKNPWGPWALVHHESPWEGDDAAYLPHLPPNWIAGDGLSGTLLFSGGWTKQGDNLYGFTTRSFRFTK